MKFTGEDMVLPVLNSSTKDYCHKHSTYLSSNGDLDVDTWLNGDLGNLLDRLSWSVQVNVSLVDSHLVSLPGLGTLTVWSLSGRDSQGLSWHSNWTLFEKVLSLSVLDDVLRHLLKLLDLGGDQGDSDLVDFWFFNDLLFFRHDGMRRSKLKIW
ncbi:hypothetical protein OGATHE_003457 [Ogataea polymorpha]|uniref:Uncharacterized protein n=1 Tax=Ogataea polymorpha TaxID=460523 RepID=A0A9P8P3M6_9ASCO|nr:hypothetical protein OGATHE_003457 [Ogataea polymorpha]